MKAQVGLFAGVLAMTSFGPAVVPAIATVRGPDAHMIRQIRGDVLVVQEKRDDIYVAPHRGWTYRRLREGQRLKPAFYDARYVVAAPRGVAPTRGASRWIRYGNDLVLVDARDGRIQRVLAGDYHKRSRG